MGNTHYGATKLSSPAARVTVTFGSLRPAPVEAISGPPAAADPLAAALDRAFVDGPSRGFYQRWGLARQLV